jgi:hypothetical protein
VSSPNFYPACESEEWALNALKNNAKMSPWILRICPSKNLRRRSIGREQNALPRGFLGPGTETAANRLCCVEAPPKTQDVVGTFGHADLRRQIVMVGRNIIG